MFDLVLKVVERPCHIDQHPLTHFIKDRDVPPLCENQVINRAMLANRRREYLAALASRRVAQIVRPSTHTNEDKDDPLLPDDGIVSLVSLHGRQGDKLLHGRSPQVRRLPPPCVHFT